MARHADHWRPWVESGQMVIFGPVLDSSGSWGLGVVEADDEQELRAFAARDPVVTSGTGTIEVGRCWLALSGRAQPASRPSVRFLPYARSLPGPRSVNSARNTILWLNVRSCMICG